MKNEVKSVFTGSRLEWQNFLNWDSRRRRIPGNFFYTCYMYYTYHGKEKLQLRCSKFQVSSRDLTHTFPMRMLKIVRCFEWSSHRDSKEEIIQKTLDFCHLCFCMIFTYKRNYIYFLDIVHCLIQCHKCFIVQES